MATQTTSLYDVISEMRPGQVVMVDFWKDGSADCAKMSAVTYSDSAVQKAFAGADIRLVKLNIGEHGRRGGTP